MADLDLDTAVLADAGARLRAAASAVAAAPAGGGGGGSPVGGELGSVELGDAGLAAAYDSFWGAWSPAHRALVADLEALATSLARAAETFEEAEHVNAASLAGMLGATPGGRTQGTP